MRISATNLPIIRFGLFALGLNWFVLTLYVLDVFSNEEDFSSAQKDNLSSIRFKLRDRPPDKDEYFYVCGTCASLPPRRTRYYTGSTNFIWPVYISNRIVGEYDDPGSQGLLIETPQGTPVKASDDGVIISADQSKDLGMLVIIRHSNGFISYYGHNSALEVTKGSSVSRGQVIAKSGLRTKDNAPLLLFGLRHPEIGGGHEILNPRAYL